MPRYKIRDSVILAGYREDNSAVRLNIIAYRAPGGIYEPIFYEVNRTEYNGKPALYFANADEHNPGKGLYVLVEEYHALQGFPRLEGDRPLLVDESDWKKEHE